MRIACPSCAAEYDVPTSRVTPGKMVRCARCGGEWMAAGEAEPDGTDVEPVKPTREFPPEPVVQPIAPSPAPAAVDRLTALSSPMSSRTGLIGAWALTIIVLAGAVTAAVLWREDIVRTWPPSGRILASAGHPAPKTGPIAGNDAK